MITTLEKERLTNGMKHLDQMINSRKEELFFYSPYSFIREFKKDDQLEQCVSPLIKSFEGDPANKVIEIRIGDSDHLFFLSFLRWDTEYFGFKTYKLQYVLYDHHDNDILTRAVDKLREFLSSERAYCFMEIPCEDVSVIGSLCANSFRLVETRLTYYRGNLKNFEYQRFPVRSANVSDTENLMRVAKEMRNNFDRFHADNVFGESIADNFLATYIEKSISGLADYVMVPDEAGIPSDSFFTAKYFRDEWEKFKIKVPKIVLVAVSSKTNRGWHKKLLGEMTYHLRDIGADYVRMVTQSTNRAVINNCEDLGYKLGSTTHILSINCTR